MRDDAHRGTEQGPHPLAVRLADALPTGARVLVLGAGSGRSLPPLAARGCVLEVASADDVLLEGHSGPFAAILSTHALLHGTQAGLRGRVAELAARLANGGRLFATFGSSADPRCGTGIYVPGGGWAPTEGPESGVTHAYFTRAELARLLDQFEDVQIAAYDVRDIAGRWAHPSSAGAPAIHWFVEARSIGP